MIEALKIEWIAAVVTSLMISSEGDRRWARELCHRWSLFLWRTSHGIDLDGLSLVSKSKGGFSSSSTGRPRRHTDRPPRTKTHRKFRRCSSFTTMKQIPKEVCKQLSRATAFRFLRRNNPTFHEGRSHYFSPLPKIGGDDVLLWRCYPNNHSSSTKITIGSYLLSVP